MRFIAVSPTKGGKHESKSMYINVDNIRSLDSEITKEMRINHDLGADTKTVIGVKQPKNSSITVEESVQEIMQAIKDAEDI